MPKKEQKNTLDKKTRNKVEQLSNQFIVYEQRLSERAILSPDEREEKLKQFLELYKEEFTDILFGLVDIWSKKKQAESNAFDINYEEAVEDGKLSKDETSLLKQYLRYSVGGRLDLSLKSRVNSFMVTQAMKDDIKRGAKYNSTFEASKAEVVSGDAASETREILKWLYKHSEIRTAAAEGSKKTGRKSMMMFIEAIAGRPVSQQAKIFYLVCVGHTKQCTPFDMEQAITKGPKLNAFRKAMNKSKANFFVRISGDKMYWNKLSDAVVLVDEKLQHGQGFVEAGGKPEDVQAAEENIAEHKEEVKEEKQELEKNKNEKILYDDGEHQIAEPIKLEDHAEEQEQQGENQQGNARQGGVELEKTKLKPFFEEKATREIEAIEKEIEDLKANDTMSEKAKQKAVEKLTKKLTKILEKQKRLIDGSVGIEDTNNWILDYGTYVGSAATMLENTKVMDAAMGIAILADAAALGSKLYWMVKNYKYMEPKEVAREMALISTSAFTMTKDVLKLGALTQLVKAGKGVKEAGEVLSNSNALGMASSAMGVLTGTMTIVKGANEAVEAKNMKKGAGAAEEKLAKSDGLEGDGALYANDLTKYARSMANTRAAKAAYNIVNGAMSTISSIFNLTGLGAIIGIPMTIIQYGALLVGWVIKKKKQDKEKLRVLDRFFKIDAAVDVFNSRFIKYFNDMNQGKDKKYKPSKMEKSMEQDLRKELRAYGESLIGVTSDDAAINLIQTRYADYLWNKVFVNPKAQGGKKYWQFSDYSKSTDNLEQDEIERYACKDVVTGTGTPCHFSKNGTEQPQTTMTEIKRRLTLE